MTEPQQGGRLRWSELKRKLLDAEHADPEGDDQHRQDEKDDFEAHRRSTLAASRRWTVGVRQLVPDTNCLVVTPRTARAFP